MPSALERSYGGPLSIPLRPDEPTVIANFVSTIDGVVALDTEGATGGGEISGFYEPDRFVMGLLRTLADAVVIGAGSVRAAPTHRWTASHVHRASAVAFAAWRRNEGIADPEPTTIVVSQPPQRGVRVQQQLHRAPSSSAMSSGSSSKSSARRTRPRQAPRTEASAEALRTGTSRAAGFPLRAMTMSSPASARSTNCESFVFASCIPTCVIAGG